MYKTASQIADEVFYKCAAKKEEDNDSSPGYGRQALNQGLSGAGLGALAGALAGAGVGAIPLLGSLAKGKGIKPKQLKSALKVMGILGGGGAAYGGAAGAGGGLATAAYEDKNRGAKSKGTLAGGALGSLAGLVAAYRTFGIRNPLLSFPAMFAGRALGGLAGSGIGLGTGAAIDKLTGK